MWADDVDQGEGDGELDGLQAPEGEPAARAVLGPGAAARA